MTAVVRHALRALDQLRAVWPLRVVVNVAVYPGDHLAALAGFGGTDGLSVDPNTSQTATGTSEPDLDRPEREAWVVTPTAVRDWLDRAAATGPDGVPELMTELELQGVGE